MAGRRTSLASLAGQKVDDVPGRSDPLLLSLPLDKLHCTRFNPRRNFGTEDELRDFGEKLKKQQLQPAVVVSRAAYLKLWPEEAERVGAAPYVIANGERRYRASQLVGRPALDVVHNEAVAASRADFLDAVQSENNDRQNLDPIERAIGIETMVTELGGADQVAVYYGKSKGWVSQQRKLLKLTRELQDLVSSGEMPVRVARDIAGLPEQVQPQAWQEEVERRRQEKEAAAQLRAQAANPPAPEPAPAPATRAPSEAVSERERFTAVNHSPAPPPAAPASSPAEPHRFTAVNRQGDSPAITPTPVTVADPRLPEARVEEAPARMPVGNGTPPRLPYDDGVFLAQHLILKMPQGEFDKMVGLLVAHQAQRSASVS